jgi:Spy/CpxP family protein refolding chaperone
MPTQRNFSLRLLLVGLLVAVAGSFALTAYAQGGPHGRMGHHHHDGGMTFMGGRGLERMLDSVNASAEQRTQIRQIAQAAHADLKAQRDAGRVLRERQMQLFTQPTVDANAAEQLRQQMLAQHDQRSRRVMQAMLDASRVLTPEQRQQLAQKMQQRRDMMQRHMQERRNLEGGASRPAR